jgi:hypothetical protein
LAGSGSSARAKARREIRDIPSAWVTATKAIGCSVGPAMGPRRLAMTALLPPRTTRYQVFFRKSMFNERSAGKPSVRRVERAKCRRYFGHLPGSAIGKLANANCGLSTPRSGHCFSEAIEISWRLVG